LKDWEKGAVIGLTGGVIALLVHAAVDSVFHELSLVLLLILCGSLALSFRQPRQEKIRVACTCSPAFTAAAVVLSVLLAVFVARPAMAWFALEKGNHLSKAGQTEPASQWYQWATTIEPGNTASWDALAHIDLSAFRASGDPARLAQAVDRITLCRELNALDPRFPARLGALYLLMANQLRDDNKKEWMMNAASESFEQAITLDPFSPFNYAELGKIRWKQSRLDEAKALFVRALRYEPNFLPARVLLATLASSRGQLDDARDEYETIHQIQSRYKGYPSNSMERQFLEVDLAPLEKSLSLQAGR
jgi:tetratricopeptide (TPR) repeat protein